MGKPIVYCERCGHSLREEEFSLGRASWVDGRPVCATCRPVPAAAETPSRATPRRTPASPRRAAPRPGSSRPILLGGVAAGVVLLLVIAAVAGRRPAPARPPAEAPATDPAEEAAVEARALERRARHDKDQPSRLDGFLQDVRKLASEDPAFARRLEALAMFDAARKVAGPREGDVDRLRSEYEREFHEAARRLADFTRAEAERLAAGKKYGDALAKIDAFPGPFAATEHAAPLAALRRELAAKVDPAARLRARPRHEASHVWKDDAVEALSDGKLPRASGDTTIPRFTWWDRKGTTEWVSWNFEAPRKVSACDVYWFDDAGAGSCRVPASWKLFYLEGEAWREVRGATALGVERDRFNRVTFEPVETASLKMEVLLRPDASGGVLEWRVE